MSEFNIDNETKKDIEKAIEILKDKGCVEIYIFGSIVNGNFNDKSDIDIAIKGLQSEKFFAVLGELLMNLNREVDLIDLDEEDNSFVKYLLSKKEMVRVA